MVRFNAAHRCHRCSGSALVCSHHLLDLWRRSRRFRHRPEGGYLAALRFLRTEQLRGPIFNNFDVGGYLIYSLYPRERVYVDNRPEAYPATFFAEITFHSWWNDVQWRLALVAP